MANQPPLPSPPPRKRGRPKKDDSAFSDTRERLIRYGIETLTEQGYASTGIDKILKAMGVPKGSFYHYFKSKEDFAAAVIMGYGDYFAKKLDRWLRAPDRLPLDRLNDFITDAKNGMERFDYRRGCLIGNLGQELGSTQDTLRPLMENVFQDWEGRVEKCLLEAQEKQQISAQHDCRALAAFFWIGWEGAILRAKLVRSNEPIDTFCTHFFKIISL